MPDDSVQTEKTDQSPPLLFAQFLEDAPPGTTRFISDLVEARPGKGFPLLTQPDLQLHCDSAHCRGTRFFACKGARYPFAEQEADVFLTYYCRNCNKSSKTFALYVARGVNSAQGIALKYGEMPMFGPPTPPRVISLIGPDREAYIKGRRAENLGLGIGAFAYYRRVVENQKDRLLDEILRVAEKTGARKEVVEALTAAKKEFRFSAAVEMVQEAIPEALLIDRHNPLTLLHKALSEGLHAKSDEACLELATSIRLVLEELAERAGVALKDHAELKSAVSRLFNRT